MNKFAAGLSVAISVMLVGCVSPLRSTDPEIRKQALEKISDEKELFFVAMNVGVGIKGKWPELYQQTHLRNGKYPEDVRVMAVKKITNPKYLLLCASWQDGDIYVDPASEDSWFEYQGERYNLGIYAPYNMKHAISPGNAVREAAIERLADPVIFKSLPKAILVEGKEAANAAVRVLFPGDSELFFCHSREIRPDNPMNNVIAKAAERQPAEAKVRFLTDGASWLSVVAPLAYDGCIRSLTSINNEDATKLYSELFLKNEQGCPASRFYTPASRFYTCNSSINVCKETASKIKEWVWLVYKNIDNPSVEIVESALKSADQKHTEDILGRIKNPEIFVTIFGGDDFAKRAPKEKRRTFYVGFGHEKTDLLPEAAKDILKPLSDEEALLTLATQAKLFSIRYAAIDKIASEAALAKIANDPMRDCPYDTSLKEFELFGDYIEWTAKTEKKSAMNLRMLAIRRMKDVAALKALRKADKSEVIKKCTTERLVALGYSHAGDIIAYEKYDKDLFSMMAEIRKTEDLQKISTEAKLKGVRLLAASKLDANAFAAIARKEFAGNTGKASAGRFVVGGYYLGLNIEDMFAKLVVEYPDTEPTIYLDGGVLCIAGGDGRDIAWADAKSLDVHWITLPLSIVKRIAGFKAGTFKDLERAVERKLGVSFDYDVIRKGNVSQKIGSVKNTEGETLRYFKSSIDEGEDIDRSVRKLINTNSVGSDPFAALGAGLANAIEDAQQADENRANACRPIFQPQGSLQLF